MENKEAEALECMADGDKCVNSSKGFLNSFFGGSRNKLEDACRAYTRAGNLYKMSKKWYEAGSAYKKSAEIFSTQLSSKHEAATSLVDAANCFKKVDVDAATDCFQQAIDIYTDMGRFTTAAKNHVNIAELCEQDQLNLERAIQNYKMAADIFDGEESKSSANKCYLKMAHYYAQLEKYTQAIEQFDLVATRSLESSLLKYSAKEHMFKAIICQFCLGGSTNAKQQMERYMILSPAFEDSRECKLIGKLVKAFDESSSDEFAESVAHYDRITRLDEWLTSMLLRIKNLISRDEDQEIDSDDENVQQSEEEDLS